MNMFVLIMVLSFSGNGRPAIITAEFDTLKACETARKQIASDMKNAIGHVVSHGCYGKGTGEAVK